MFAARPFTIPSSLLFLVLSGAPGSLLADESLFRAAAEANVNQRYLIESVSVGGVQVDRAKLPSSLRRRLISMVGARCDMTAIGEMASQLRKELHFRSVNEHLSRGSQPDQIRLNFEVEKRDATFEVSVPKFLYHSNQGFTGDVEANIQIGQQNFSLGAVSNRDDLTEHFMGIVAHYQSSKVFSDRLHFEATVEDFHEQWSDSTRGALRAAGSGTNLDLYRTRRNIAPELTFTPVKSLSVSAGVSFEQMNSETPSVGLTSANSAIAEVRFGHKMEDGDVRQSVDGRYSLRVGMSSLKSDYSYSRHVVSLRYEVKSGRQFASDELMAGGITGNAPFFERFVLGSSTTLRGWDRYAISPLGGNRVAHNSLTYGVHFGDKSAEVFYDAGAIWNSGRPGVLRHSLGVGYRQGVFILTMAFPVIDGRVTPVFMAGMNY